jgi:periplasmic divalent cation tolerance protein
MKPASVSTGLVIVLTTVDASTDVATLARTLVEERLAACVNVLSGLTSVYRWKGAIEETREQQLVVKTVPSRLESLEARLSDLHPYEVPEFIVLAGKANAAYQSWVEDSIATPLEHS